MLFNALAIALPESMPENRRINKQLRLRAETMLREEKDDRFPANMAARVKAKPTHREESSST